MSVSTQSNTHYTRPFLKWAGNKFQLLAAIQSMLPTGQRLIEPFLGSAVVFLNCDYKHYLLNDKNHLLITLYKTLKKYGDDFINAVSHYYQPRYNNKKKYYQLRDTFNQCDDPFENSVLLMYLNRHGYNGLCRFNRQGKYNVPFGQYKKPKLPVTTMQSFHQRSQHCHFYSQDFRTIMRRAKAGDVIYCDPPYVPLTKTAFFTNYWETFDMDHQQQLVTEALACAKRGIPVLISNHDTSVTRKLYQKAQQIESFEVQRHISCKVNKREKVRELLALYR